MASVTTGRAIRTVTLHYAGNKITPEKLSFHKGELIQFVSDQPGYEVYVKLNPKAYKPSVFTPTSGPVEVLKDPGGTSRKAPCGILETQTGVLIGWPRIDTLGPETDPCD